MSNATVNRDYARIDTAEISEIGIVILRLTGRWPCPVDINSGFRILLFPAQFKKRLGIIFNQTPTSDFGPPTLRNPSLALEGASQLPINGACCIGIIAELPPGTGPHIPALYGRWILLLERAYDNRRYLGNLWISIPIPGNRTVHC